MAVPMNWLDALYISGSVASIISVIISLFVMSGRRRLIVVIGSLVFAAFFLFLAFRNPSEDESQSVLNLKISTDQGTLYIADFLTVISRGPAKIVIDPQVAQDLRRRGIKITTPPLNGASLKYVLDEYVLPQLPGPQQWTYEVAGMTVRIKRR